MKKCLIREREHSLTTPARFASCDTAGSRLTAKRMSGFSGYSVIYKVWNEAKNREMSLGEMVALLTALVSEPAAAAAAAAAVD